MTVTTQATINTVPTPLLTKAGRTLRRRRRHLESIITEAPDAETRVPMTVQEAEAIDVALLCIAAVLDDRGCDPQLVAKVTRFNTK